MSRKLISNVPLITQQADGYAHLTSFIGALYGALQGIGEKYQNAELLSYSGLGNRLCWTEGKWIFGNEDIENCNTYPFEIQDRLVSVIGWKAKRIVMERDGREQHQQKSAAQIRQDFVESINRGIPVIAQGITDDGCKHDYDVFFGYEDDFSKCSLHPSDNAPNDENGANSLEHRFIIYCDALTQINQRGQILPYYKQLVNLYPEWAQELNTAIAAWSECANYGGYLWSQGFSFDDEGFEKFRSPHMRKILADEGRRAMKRDIEAIEQIERILQKENR